MPPLLSPCLLVKACLLIFYFANRKSRDTPSRKMAEKDAKDVAIEENTVAKDIVVTKYKMAAEIVNGTALI